MGRIAAWPQNAFVTVYAGDGFGSAEQIRCITDVLATFNNSAGSQTDGNVSGVYFDFTYGTTDQDLDSSGNTVNGQPYVMRINRRTPVSGIFGEAGGQAANLNGVDTRYNATININPNITDCEAFKQTLAHEIGHTLGLGECTACTVQKQSIMVGATGFNDTASGLTAPRSCDVAVWNATGAYQAINLCNSGHVIQCIADTRNRWDFTRCSCCILCVPGGGGGGGEGNNCWNSAYNWSYRQGFCTYYMRHIDRYCGGVHVDSFDVIDSVDCQEIG